MKLWLSIFAIIFITGCSVVGQSDVESAPYTLIKEDKSKAIEVRNYNSMVLVSTSMSSGETNSAFRRLFNYISGENSGAAEIAMTAPVLMAESNSTKLGTEISMTTPVLMSQNAQSPVMSFVMPANFTLATTPNPTNPKVTVSEVTNYKVAAIQFNGTLSDNNVAKHTKILMVWIDEQGYIARSEAVEASYNGPLTLPMWRKNEILVEVE